ncbi:MAG: ATP synthase F0 subunit C [Anaerolineales bacterium]|nr:ATP synthase F0 subunit C [Anaerolineales bacterium]
MAEMDPNTLVLVVTIIIAGAGIVLGTAIPALAEGRAVEKALDNMARQPSISRDIRTTLLISMALLESTAIYVLLVMLILIFANPLVDRLL